MSNQNQLVIIQKDITDDVNKSLTRLQDDGLVLPSNYNASNALKSAFFKLQEVRDKNGALALEVCSRESIANSLLDMVVQGLSPAKTQCYFIVYGNQLQLNRSYFGTQAVLKRLTNVKDIWANVIFEGDVFDYEIDGGREKLLKHESKFQNRDKDILGAYAVIKTIEDVEILTVMTRKEIETSWSQAKTKSVQNKFPQEMAKRTVINRAAKSFINTSDDSDLLVQAINNSTENEYENERVDVTPDEVQKQIEENANSEIIDMEYEDSEIQQDQPEDDSKPSAMSEEPPF
ncbi:recombinase RecT [Bacillus atrophaeus]|uniref:recombinase RecT n=1 Tax=Bacillus atrophaeus TaxID=1452 RepID=UPI002280EB26|nr:RecT family recombinase [Bacillus atrophaeus]MCY8513512.1 recombinase RecT [Bacillus atrophaeus]MCY8992616.1 recombinase RecT [Bacillus atrophaeus]MCY9162701.1 recombinase RecT [Bacillus atrophaeus]MEC0765703.1 recombinase RecT [Bacillus atrophaeus]MEC0781530.1 recombinase RecT [Bacillus atrophaeus]